MINTFYEALQNAQAWFFGSSLLADPFFSALVTIFNALLLFTMFYGVLLLPLRFLVHWFIKRLKAVESDDE